jgi:uncharacterized protein
VTTYVDTSVLVKLVIEEPGSAAAALIWKGSGALGAVALVTVEARAALAAARRAGRLSAAQHRRAKTHLGGLIDQLDLVRITDDLIGQAADLAEEEALRGYDAVHLAGAVLLDASVMATADRALADAAGRRGLHVADLAEPT